jgi:hypothetical protein
MAFAEHLAEHHNPGGVVDVIEMLNDLCAAKEPVIESNVIKVLAERDHLGRKSLDSAVRLPGVHEGQYGKSWYWARNETEWDVWRSLQASGPSGASDAPANT